MTDLFTNATACHREERAGILEFDAGIPRETAETMADRSSEQFRHDCEVRSVVAMYHKDGGEAVKSFLADVAKHRGRPAADRLRADALKKLKNN